MKSWREIPYVLFGSLLVLFACNPPSLTRPASPSANGTKKTQVSSPVPSVTSSNCDIGNLRNEAITQIRETTNYEITQLYSSAAEKKGKVMIYATFSEKVSATESLQVMSEVDFNSNCQLESVELLPTVPEVEPSPEPSVSSTASPMSSPSAAPTNHSF